MSFSFVTLASEIPRTSASLRDVACATDSIVLNPAAMSFSISFGAMPCS